MTGFFLVLAACAFWALDSLVRYPLVNGGVDAFAIVFYEHLILSVIFLVVFFKSLPKIWDSKLSHLFYFFMIGGVGSALATLAFTRAFYFLNPSLVILLQKFQPVIAISLARIVLKEKVQRVFILWALVCLAGALLISYEDILNLYTSEKNISELLLHPGALQGYILVFISVFGWGAATVFGKKLF
ncbi:MAG: DMT family transporter, partial [Halobacteriovoraceae bacterium]|nr:DMT family transporter [Halobacteriovoraceae bacterium]